MCPCGKLHDSTSARSSPYFQINILFLTTYIGEGYNNSDGKESLKRQKSQSMDAQEMSKFY